MYVSLHTPLEDGVKAKRREIGDGVAIMSPGATICLILSDDEADTLARQIRTILCDKALASRQPPAQAAAA